MKVLLFTPYAEWTPHFETDLEIAKDYLDAGAEVHALVCRRSLPGCEPNPNFLKTICSSCISRSEDGLNRIGIKAENIHYLGSPQPFEVDPKSFDSIDSLKRLSVGKNDVGMAAASSLISLLREPKPSLRKHRTFLSRTISANCWVFERVSSLLSELQVDKLVLFNGRYCSIRPALRAAQVRGVNADVHERGANENLYWITKNTYPHDLGAVADEVKNFWSKSNLKESEKERTGASWFEQRRQGADQNWTSFTASQARDRLPVGFDINKRNIVIFNSSQDEVEAIEGWQNVGIGSQDAALMQLLDLPWPPEFKFYLRVHPNLKSLQNSQTKNIDSLSYPNLHIVSANSEVDTYALLGCSEKVITFGSTVGVEATYWGVPSILLGHAFYEQLDAAYMPTSIEEAAKLIRATLAPKSKAEALKYGLWASLYGTRFRSFAPEGLFSGKFLGKPIRAALLKRVLCRISKLAVRLCPYLFY